VRFFVRIAFCARPVTSVHAGWSLLTRPIPIHWVDPSTASQAPFASSATAIDREISLCDYHLDLLLTFSVVVGSAKAPPSFLPSRTHNIMRRPTAVPRWSCVFVATVLLLTSGVVVAQDFDFNATDIPTFTTDAPTLTPIQTPVPTVNVTIDTTTPLPTASPTPSPTGKYHYIIIRSSVTIGVFCHCASYLHIV
jgi:hypothetical protein